MTHGTVSAALAMTLAATLPAGALPAAAGDLQNSSVTPRELVHCMMKRMKEDRSQSYRAVFKVCRQDLEAAQSIRASDTAMNSDSTATDAGAAAKQ